MKIANVIPLYICLVHYPVKNQNNEIINTSITNLDVHDLARLSTTYNLAGYYIVQPLKKQRELFLELLDYWKTGAGSCHNSTRAEAFSKVKLVASVDECVHDISTEMEMPVLVATGARIDHNISFLELRNTINIKPIMLMFGTGWGLADEIINQADFRLEAIEGIGSYNHLSVRSATSIILDRLCTKKWW